MSLTPQDRDILTRAERTLDQLPTMPAAQQTRELVAVVRALCRSISRLHQMIPPSNDEITLKTGSASLRMKKDGSIAIKGSDVAIESSGKMNIKSSGALRLMGPKVAQN